MYRFVYKMFKNPSCRDLMRLPAHSVQPDERNDKYGCGWERRDQYGRDQKSRKGLHHWL